jgi:hypothetical protein
VEIGALLASVLKHVAALNEEAGLACFPHEPGGAKREDRAAASDRKGPKANVGIRPKSSASGYDQSGCHQIEALHRPNVG